MTSSASTEPVVEPLPQGGARPRLWKNVAAALVCVAWNAAFLLLSLELPAGHSRGDVGPGMVPMQIAVLGLVVSGIYLVQVLRGIGLEGSGGAIDVPRVAGLVALFAAAGASAAWIGLAVSLGLAAGAATLLFHGERLILRALATGVGFWAIAYFVFARLLQLPLP
ncbi:tripartite tricarboxylate transporter TctB family protein [Mesorhizobium sp. 8]|jgi:hypothetical protein|uniref:tripartite tricarboxylate transporter TctB family protein n=1 Tax=Mesorhizobium sp. 8 TaxID=2584466 RepID=UPI001121CB3E|nr:tripartite tricarboxylate transporter TctB family protein [Mesorhizobium sp. 8]QDC00692.1 tripartite tricarboxylate transporter TctB family protein [Mesorhizobium sp. 8]